MRRRSTRSSHTTRVPAISIPSGMLILVERGDLAHEDVYKLTPALAAFHRHKRRLPLAQRDINQHRDYRKFMDLLDPYAEVPTARESRREEKDKILAEVRTVYDGPEGRILVPETEAASCFLGQGTRWCTAAREDNAYKDYAPDGPLYVLLPADAEGGLGREAKFQFHLPTVQLVDSGDAPVERNTFAGVFPALWSRLQEALSEEEVLHAIEIDYMALSFVDNPSREALETGRIP